MEKFKTKEKEYSAMPFVTARKFIREVADGSRKMIIRMGTQADKMMITTASYDKLVESLMKGESPSSTAGLRTDFDALSLYSTSDGGGKVIVEVEEYGVVRLEADDIKKLAPKYDEISNCERYVCSRGFTMDEYCNPCNFSLANKQTPFYWFSLGKVLHYEEPKGEVRRKDPVI